MEYGFEGASPSIDSEAAVCAEATLIGDVTVGPHSSVWPGAVLRGDFGSVSVGSHSHVEEQCVLHDAIVKDEVIVGHGAILNEATIEDRVLVGMNSTVNQGVEVGSRSLVAPNAVIPQGRAIPSESIVRGVPARVTPVSETEYDIEELLGAYAARDYSDLVSRHDQLFSSGSN